MTLSSSTAPGGRTDPMRICYLILAHRYPEQLERLIQRLDSSSTSFLIHIDRKTDDASYRRLVERLDERPNVYFLKRYTCHWAGFGIVQATMEGIRYAVEHRLPFDYLALLSGQDYPIKSNGYIQEFLRDREGISFIHHNPFPFAEWEHHRGGWDRVLLWHFRTGTRHVVFPAKERFGSPRLDRLGDVAAALFPFKRTFPRGYHPFGGAQFWCLHRAHVRLVHDVLQEDPRFMRFFRFVDVPDEILFQTIAGNRIPPDQLCNDTLTHVEWYRPGATLYRTDLEALRASGHLFARKFDMTVDPEILDLVDQELLGVPA